MEEKDEISFLVSETLSESTNVLESVEFILVEDLRCYEFHYRGSKVQIPINFGSFKRLEQGLNLIFTPEDDPDFILKTMEKLAGKPLCSVHFGIGRLVIRYPKGSKPLPLRLSA